MSNTHTHTHTHTHTIVSSTLSFMRTPAVKFSNSLSKNIFRPSPRQGSSQKACCQLERVSEAEMHRGSRQREREREIERERERARERDCLLIASAANDPRPIPMHRTGIAAAM